MTSIYLAGKVAKNDWRHEVVSTPQGWGGLRGTWPEYDSAPTEPWPILPAAVLGVYDYAGPYFYSCDHGCAHGANSHGCGAGFHRIEGAYPAPSRNRVRALCMRAIDDSDIVFAWLDDPTAYGTLVELGYARGRGKKVVLAAPKLLDDLWFAASCATSSFTAETPRQALELMALDFDSPFEPELWKKGGKIPFGQWKQ